MNPHSSPSPLPMRLGVCYYPEQWPESQWATDARRMRELGLQVVRIAEFGWSRMEPEPGRFDWAWLDRAIAALADEGLQVVLGTPTASPPSWLMHAHPDIAPVGPDGRPKAFGARRHYCFSNPAFHDAARRIVTAMARRYGAHPSVVAWQTDNEFGCHDTVLSWSPAALAGFRRWLAERYGSIDALNTAWGTAFWGLQLRGFDEVVLPAGQPTSPLPAHALDFRRFASDEVLRFHRMQVEILREHSPGRDVLHNFMGFFGDFDHHAMAADLDVAAWDNYPLGFLEVAPFLGEDARERHACTGHPDVSAFHHDLYRGVGRGRCWVMEQQAGPVNWAPWNALPLPGMVRAWTWQAFAHGAELVSYFRWRQLPYGQEQMHSGLHTPDDRLDRGGEEVRQVAAELRGLEARDVLPRGRATAPVALVLDYTAKWMVDLQPQGADMHYFGEAFRYYSALRALGLDIDVVGPDAPLDAYAMVVLPALLHVPPSLEKRLAATGAVCVVGPRGGSKTADFALPGQMPPGPLQRWLQVTVRGVESLRPGHVRAVREGERAAGAGRQWRDLVELPGSDVGIGRPVPTARARYDDGWPAWCVQDRWHLHAGVVDEALLRSWLADAATQAGLAARTLPPGLRMRRRGDWRVAIHHGPGSADVPAPADAEFLVGGRTLAPAGVAIWREPE